MMRRRRAKEPLERLAGHVAQDEWEENDGPLAKERQVQKRKQAGPGKLDGQGTKNYNSAGRLLASHAEESGRYPLIYVLECI